MENGWRKLTCALVQKKGKHGAFAISAGGLINVVALSGDQCLVSLPCDITVWIDCADLESVSEPSPINGPN